MTSPKPAVERLRSIDALRGIAVGLMVGWHFVDGWLVPEAREGWGWHAVRIIGGTAAPLFIGVAGLSVGLAVSRGVSRIAIARRGLWVVALGGLLQIQQWFIDAGGWTQPSTWSVVLCGGLGWGALLVLGQGTTRDRRLRCRVALALACGLGLGLFFWRVPVDLPAHAPRLLAFEVLHCIGFSIVIAAGLSRWGAWSLMLAATLVLVLAGFWGPELQAVERWGGGFGAAVSPIATRFSLVPWLAYALAGCAVARCHPPSRLSMLIAGLALSMTTFEGGLDAVRRMLHDHPELRPICRAVFHAGAIICAGAVARTLAGASWLTWLGRVSLPVYWLHLELAYGVLALPVARRLPPLHCGLAIAVVGAGGLFLAHRLASQPRAFDAETSVSAGR